jgi:hypothetical protein
MISLGDIVVGFYDVNTPVPLIYPPQYRAIVMSRIVPGQNVKVAYFNEQLISSDGTLKLNISPFIQILLVNDQVFTANHNLLVVYGPTTRSFPAQTTPYRITVICPKVNVDLSWVGVIVGEFNYQNKKKKNINH